MATPTTLPAAFTTGQVLTAAQMNNLRGAFRVMQVIQTVKSDGFSASLAAGASTDITGLNVTITPSSTSSRILVLANVNGAALYTLCTIKLLRGTTEIANGDAVGTRTRVAGSGGTQVGAGNGFANAFVCFLDSPNTTSATTYKVQITNSPNYAGTDTLFVNRGTTDADNTSNARTQSQITVMEISA